MADDRGLTDREQWAAAQEDAALEQATQEHLHRAALQGLAAAQFVLSMIEGLGDEVAAGDLTHNEVLRLVQAALRSR